VAVIKSNIATLLSGLGDTQQSEKLYAESVQNVVETNAADFATQATLLNNQGDNYRLQQNFEAAMDCYEKALDFRRKVSNEDIDHDLEAAKTLYSLSKLYSDAGNLDKSLSTMKTAFQIIDREQGTKFPQYVNLLLDLGTINYRLKNFVTAQEYFEQGLSIQKERGDTGMKLFATLQNLAVCLTAQMKYKDSEDIYDDCLRILNETLSTVKDAEQEKALNKTMRTILNNLTGNLVVERKFQLLEQRYQELMNLTVDEFGDRSLEVGEVAKNLGACYVYMEKFDEAEKEMAKAVVIFQEKLGKDHDTTITCENSLQDIRRKIYENRGGGCCGCLLQ